MKDLAHQNAASKWLPARGPCEDEEAKVLNTLDNHLGFFLAATQHPGVSKSCCLKLFSKLSAYIGKQQIVRKDTKLENIGKSNEITS